MKESIDFFPPSMFDVSKYLMVVTNSLHSAMLYRNPI